MLGEPVGMGGLDARIGPAAAALQLAALHRQHGIVAAGIAGDDFQLRPEHADQHLAELDGVVAGPGAADQQFLVQDIVECREARGVPGDAHAHLVIGAADPVELGAVELRAGLPEQRIERGAAADSAEHAAVPRRGGGEPVGETDARRALHVLRHHRGVAGKVLAEVARQQTGIEVVAAADAVAGVDVDGLAFERGRVLRERDRRGRDEKRKKQMCGESESGSEHCAEPSSLSLPGLTGQPSNPRDVDLNGDFGPPGVRWLLDRPVKPGDDSA